MKKSKGQKIFDFINVFIMLLVVFICLAPIWHVLCASISEPSKLLASKGLLFKPLGNITLEGYRLALKNGSILRSYANTLFYVVSATSIGVVCSCFAAYALSRKNLMWKKPITFLLALTMLFSGGMIPTYLLIRNLNMLDTVWAIILPNCLSVYNIMILRTSFASLPEGLTEAARIDGAGHFRILWSIVIPCSKSIIAVIALFYMVQNWNSWFHTAIYVQDRSMYPLQLLLREIVVMNSQTGLELAGEDGARNLIKELTKYAVIIISIIPMMIIYPFIQKYFVSGVMIGSLKE